jgi:hypothetical protein
MIQQQYLARWDSSLPQYALGGNALPFIQIAAAAGDAPPPGLAWWFMNHPG